jgi:hypothetical protein
MLHSRPLPADAQKVRVGSFPVCSLVMSRSPLAALALLAVGTASCASFPGLRSSQPAANLDGVWEGSARGTIPEGLGAGDTRIERQSWHLRQDGARVRGFYVVELTMISGDGRPYVCSREPRFKTLLRFEVEGQIGQSGIELSEIGDAQAKGPCRPAFRTPARFRAEVAGDQLTIEDGSYRLTLYRRGEKAGATPALPSEFESEPQKDQDSGGSEPLNQPSPPSTAVTASLSSPPVEVDGVWVWEHRGRLPTGDEKEEREEWHLDQDGASISGYYDRSIRQISTDGLAYRCSNATDFRVTTRYHVAGEVVGSRVVLREQSFEILQPSPCDNGRRSLDAYQGEAQIDELKLIWGVGSQVLRRDRAEIPSMHF